MMRLGFALLVLTLIPIGIAQADALTVSVLERSPEIDFALQRLERTLVARQMTLTVSPEPGGDVSLHCARISTRTVGRHCG
jgi:hypothetical protein